MSMRCYRKNLNFHDSLFIITLLPTCRSSLPSCPYYYPTCRPSPPSRPYISRKDGYVWTWRRRKSTCGDSSTSAREGGGWALNVLTHALFGEVYTCSASLLLSIREVYIEHQLSSIFSLTCVCSFYLCISLSPQELNPNKIKTCILGVGHDSFVRCT
jgi:hypothetical protein